MEGVCAVHFMSRWDYPPPEMVKGCVGFLGVHSEDIVQGLVKRESNESAENDICFERTKVCIETENRQKDL
jgi:hypothetical protein